MQNQQPQQYQDSSKEVAPQPRYNTQPIKQNQYVYYNEPQVQYQPEVDSQQQLEPKVISEEEYLELVRRQNGQNVNHTSPSKYEPNRGRQYKIQQSFVPNEHPQSYLKTYNNPSTNPLGDFSLEKELAQLEKSNKALYHENAEKDTEQSSKKERYEFKPSHQFVEYQQDQFLPPEYAQYRPVSQKLISSPYEREESASEKTNNQPEYQIRFASPTEVPVKYYQEALKTKNSFVPLPKQHYQTESDSASHANANLAKKHSQLIYQKQHQHQHTTAPSVQQSAKASPHKQPVKAASSEKFPQFQSNNYNAASQSSIFVSQGTGVQQKPQVENEQQEIQQHQQANQQVQQQHQYEHQQPQHPQHHPRIPPTNPNRPLTQEEFQALVDAGYKVQAIPIPVPVPVSAEVYAQHQQQQQQQQQQHRQQYQHPFQLQQQNNPSRPQYQAQYQPQPQSNPSIRPQPSNKHFVRYYPQQSEGVLTSYLRPLLEQYNNLMGGKI